MLLFAIVRAAAHLAWIWGTRLRRFCFVMFTALIGPVYLQPIFNDITRLDDPKVTGPILRHGPRQRHSIPGRLRDRRLAAVYAHERECERVCGHVADYAERQSAATGLLRKRFKP
jgi:hypothetical protein